MAGNRPVNSENIGNPKIIKKVKNLKAIRHISYQIPFVGKTRPVLTLAII